MTPVTLPPAMLWPAVKARTVTCPADGRPLVPT